MLIKDDNAHLTATISVSGGDICAESVVNLKEQSHEDMPAMFRTCIGITSLRGSVKKQKNGLLTDLNMKTCGPCAICMRFEKMN